MNIDVQVTDDGHIRIVFEQPYLGDPISHEDARTLVRMLLAAAEKAQSICSHRGDGMPERVTTEEMRSFK